MTREEAILYLEHTSSDDFNLEEHQIKNRLNAIQFLLKENQELREALEIKSYCKYANKCNEIYDCSREEYEDMANANMRLNVENQTLKKQLENCYCNRTDCSGRIKDSKVYDSLVQKVANQQKEFINYLQKEIKFYNDRVEAIDSVCSSIYSEDYDNSKMKLAIYKEILQKYKEIIQTKNNNSV